MTSAFLVIDVGTTGLRAAVVDESLAIVTYEHRPCPPSSPAPGLVEFDASDMASKVLDAAEVAIARFGSPIDALGITNQRASVVVWDRVTGEPIGPGLGWQDLRTVMDCITAKAEHGWALAPNQSATKLQWLLANTPGDPDVSLQDGLIHLWFIFYLIIFYIVHLSLRPLIRFPSIQKLCNWQSLIDFTVSHRWGFLLLGVLTFPLQYLLKTAFFPPSGFNVPIVDLALYFVFYLFGVAFYRQRHLLAKLGDNAWYYFAFSVPFFILISEPTDRLDQSASVVTSITTWTFIDLGSSSFVLPAVWYEGIFHNGYQKVLIVLSRSMLCWSMCFAFIGLTHRYLSQPRKSIRYLADSAYWVYWVHLPITFKLSFMAQSVEGLNALTKSYIVLVLSSLLIFASYHWCVRYTWLGDYFMGCRKSKTDPNELQFKLPTFLRKVMLPAVSIGILIFCFGSLLHYNNEFKQPQVLVEAYVARQRSTLDAVDSIDEISDRHGNTPLHAAAKMPEGKRRYDTMPVLLSKCSNPNLQNDFGRTALFIAVKTANKGDIEQLLGAGADINIGDRYGHTPAHAAAILVGNRNEKVSNSYFEILQILSRNGADLSATDYRDRTVQDCLMMFSGRKLEPALSSELKDSLSFTAPVSGAPPQ